MSTSTIKKLPYTEEEDFYSNIKENEEKIYYTVFGNFEKEPWYRVPMMTMPTAGQSFGEFAEGMAGNLSNGKKSADGQLYDCVFAKMIMTRHGNKYETTEELDKLSKDYMKIYNKYYKDAYENNKFSWDEYFESLSDLYYFADSIE